MVCYALATQEQTRAEKGVPMQIRKKPPVQTPSEADNPMEQLSRQVMAAQEETRKKLEGCYLRLAREAEGSRKISQSFHREMGREADSLKRAAGNLRKSASAAAAMADELEVRMREAGKNRWSAAPANAAIDLREQQSRHFAQGINLYKLILVCFIGSFAGVVVETLWCLFRSGHIESRAGLIYGPFNLLYGVGAVVLTVALYRYRNRSSAISFLGGMLVGSVVEYVCSWAQEAMFGSRSWDYSRMPFNLNGRICLLYSIFWGVLGVLWIKNIYPRMARLILRVPNRIGKIATWAVVVFLVVNAAVTLAAVSRWAQRLEGQPPENGIEELLDRRFTDERMEKIFANMDFD